MKTVAAAIALLMLACAAHGANVAQLAGELDGLRATCSKQAMDAYTKHSSDAYQATLDGQLADQKALIDARVYAIGHGSRDTERNYVQQLQKNIQATAAKTQSIEAKFSAEGEAVKTCTAQAIAQGKQAYSSFKASHKRSHGEADSLMAAWLANMGEIAAGAPQGGNGTRDAWTQAKSRAELSDL